MPAPSRTGLALLVALAFAGLPAAAAVPAPKVIPPRATASVIPVRVGMSLAYRYELEQSGPRGTITTRASVALTRVASDRVTVTLTPETGEPTALAGRIATDGTLHLDAPADARGPDAGTADLPQDTPLGGLPDDPRGGQAGTGGGYGGRYGSGAGGAGGRARQTPAWTALAALLAFRVTGGTPTPSWTFSAPVGPAASGSIPLLALTAHASTAQNGLVETVVADGRGDVQLAAAGSGAFAGRMVPATVVLHVESVFRDGRLASARGTQTSTVRSGGGTDVTTTAHWTLAAY